jgi:MFS family permease
VLYEMTNSPLLLGLSGLFRAAPMIGLALFGGAVADRVPRRVLLLLTESSMLIASLTVGLLALTGQLQFWHLYALSFVSGALSAFSIPARHALFAARCKARSRSTRWRCAAAPCSVRRWGAWRWRKAALRFRF